MARQTDRMTLGFLVVDSTETAANSLHYYGVRTFISYIQLLVSRCAVIVLVVLLSATISRHEHCCYTLATGAHAQRSL